MLDLLVMPFSPLSWVSSDYSTSSSGTELVPGRAGTELSSGGNNVSPSLLPLPYMF